MAWWSSGCVTLLIGQRAITNITQYDCRFGFLYLDTVYLLCDRPRVRIPARPH